jgi:hypothetical protein
MKDAQCTVCKEPATQIAVAELRTQGYSLRVIAERVKRSKSAIERHLKHVDLPPRPRSLALRDKTSQAGRKAKRPRKDGRSHASGVSVDAPEPSSLLKRAERLMFHAETIVTKAFEDEDYRLMLQAIDRARSSLELTMKAVGLIGGDSTTINIVDSRRILEANLAQLSVDELRAIAYGKPVPAALEGDPLVEQSS